MQDLLRRERIIVRAAPIGAFGAMAFTSGRLRPGLAG